MKYLLIRLNSVFLYVLLYGALWSMHCRDWPASIHDDKCRIYELSESKTSLRRRVTGHAYGEIALIFRGYRRSPCHRSRQNLCSCLLQKDFCSAQFSSGCECYYGIRHPLDLRLILCECCIDILSTISLTLLDADIFCVANIQLVKLPIALYYQLIDEEMIPIVTECSPMAFFI